MAAGGPRGDPQRHCDGEQCGVSCGDGADEIHGAREGPQGIRPGQAGRHDTNQLRLLAGDVVNRENGRRRERLREGCIAPERLHDRVGDRRRPEKKPAEYRQKDLFDTRAFNATHLEVTRGTQIFTFQKDGEKWKQVTPAAKEVDATKVDALLSAITGARAISFVEQAPAAKPDLVVAVKSKEADERVSFHKQGTDALAVRTGTTGAAKIDPPLIDDIIKALEALK